MLSISRAPLCTLIGLSVVRRVRPRFVLQGDWLELLRGLLSVVQMLGSATLQLLAHPVLTLFVLF